MAYETNRFCWHGLITPDPDGAVAFYGEVLGFGVMKQPMGDDVATMFVASEIPVAHCMEPPMEGVPAHWDNYLRVDDVDATLTSAAAAGGAVVVPATDIPVGRFGVITSPSGAMLCVFHEANEAESEHHPGGLGSVHWTELHSADIAADLPWLTQVFGFQISEMPIPQGKYYLLNDGDQPRGGAMQKMFPDAPAMWLTWFEVDDADAAHTRVNGNGGKAITEPMDFEGVGRMFVAADPFGAVFGVMKPSAQA